VEWNLRHIPSGREGTDATLAAIGGLIAASEQTPVVRLSALSILDQYNVSAADSYSAMAALFDWTRRNVQYLPDPTDIELVQSPENTLKLLVGDCDDQATLMGAFAANLGIPARLVTVGHDPDAMEHIYPEALLNGQWTAMDTTVPNPFGFRPQLPYRKIYDLRGTPMVNLGATGQVVPVTVDAFQSSVYRAVYNQVAYDWQSGNINYADLRAYLSLFDSGGQPPELKGTPAELPARQAISDFMKTVDQAGIGTQRTGLKGLPLLDSVLGVVKSVVSVIPGVGGVLSSLIPGGGGGASIVNGQVQSANGQFPQTSDIQTMANAATPNLAQLLISWANQRPAHGLSAITSVAITSSQSSLNPPTLPIYFWVANDGNQGKFSMSANSFVPYSGTPQTIGGGAQAVTLVTNQSGAMTPQLDSANWYKINPVNASLPTATGSALTPGAASTGLFSSLGPLFSNPLVLIGGSVLVYLLLRPKRKRR